MGSGSADRNGEPGALPDWAYEGWAYEDWGLGSSAFDTWATEEARSRASGPRHPIRTAIIGALVCLLVALALGGGVVAVAGWRINAEVDRLPGVFDGLVQRPTKPTAGSAAKALNILVIGSDRRPAEDEQVAAGSVAGRGWQPGQERSDTLMVLHLDGDRRGGSVISIPRDAWVLVPGHGMAKINAAFSWGGPTLAVATVELLTGVRIDHVAVIDWDGYAALTDALSGVDVVVPETVTDSSRGVTWAAGTHHLDGAQALDYVRQRYGLPGGDLDRVQRQHAVVRALFERLRRQNPITSPRSAYDLLSTLARHVSVDETWSLREMAATLVSLRDLRGRDLDYLIAPTRGTDRVGGQSIVRLDRRANRRLWSAVVIDELPGWLTDHRASLTPRVVR